MRIRGAVISTSRGSVSMIAGEISAVMNATPAVSSVGLLVVVVIRSPVCSVSMQKYEQ